MVNFFKPQEAELQGESIDSWVDKLSLKKLVIFETFTPELKAPFERSSRGNIILESAF
ncbi:MAG: hypothetical protein RLZZ414_1540 [Bacteroidota bacterium]|jgi:hypothetical protein